MTPEQPAPIDGPQKTNLVLISPESDLDRRLDDLELNPHPGLFRCKLVVVVTQTESDVEVLDHRVRARSRGRWPLLKVYAPSELRPQPGSLEMQSSRDHFALVAYLCQTLIPKLIRAGDERPICIVWVPGDGSIGAAGAVAIAAHRRVAFIHPPGGPWSTEIRDLLQGRELRPVGSGERAALIGESKAIQAVRRRLEIVAKETLPVLLVGETGTGKEVCARELHRLSGRREDRFSTFNGAMLDPARAGSELFGHEKGAFTGAVTRHEGRLVEADEGTFFLDELDSTPLGTQAQLLRALQDALQAQVHVEPLGGKKRRIVSARFVSAVHSTTSGLVREDLLYRVAGFEIRLPPLREREQDVLVLARHFLRLLRESTGAGPERFSKRALAAMESYRWPGNVRELEASVRHGFLLSRAENKRDIDEQDLPRAVVAQDGAPSFDDGGTLRERVSRYVLAACELALATHPSNKTAAARELGFKSSQDLDRYRRTHGRTGKSKRGGARR